MQNKVQILAPAGSEQCIYAAVRCGADAVYLGAKDFNARRNADNFTFEQLGRIIGYCHARGVEVHITLNTLLRDDELKNARDFIEHICRLGADVLILQDLGLAALAKKAAPQIARHASTQMSVQTVSGMNLLESMGYSVAVLPREMTKGEIERIKKETTIKLEAFVHGALCMCVSGQCYLSAMLGGRSGNRGLCAQPCRLAFSAAEPGRHDLSLKDLSLVKSVSELAELGISSFKIEGRMKRPEYVAAAVTAVKASLDGTQNEKIEHDLGAVFSRSGFTDGYYKNNRGSEMFGIRTKEDVTAASSKIIGELSRLYDKETARIPVDFIADFFKDEPVSLCASAGGKNVFVSDDFVPQAAQNRETTKEELTARLSKCGGTPFFANEIETNLESGLYVPASVINSLRRNALEKLEAELSKTEPKPFFEPNVHSEPHRAAQEKKLRLRFSSLEQIPSELDKIDCVYIPLCDAQKFGEKFDDFKPKVGVEIPRGIFGSEPQIKKLLELAKKAGIEIAYCPTLDAVALAKELGFEIHTGFSLNVTNTLSACELEKLGASSVTLSVELTLAQLSQIGGKIERGIVAYGALPLMLTRNCPIKNVKSCGECKKKSFLTDRKNIRFPVVCSNGCSEILNSRPIYLADRLREIKNMDFITLYFTMETVSQVSGFIRAYKEEKSPIGEFTRGLYYRGVS